MTGNVDALLIPRFHPDPCLVCGGRMWVRMSLLHTGGDGLERADAVSHIKPCWFLSGLDDAWPLLPKPGGSAGGVA